MTKRGKVATLCSTFVACQTDNQRSGVTYQYELHVKSFLSFHEDLRAYTHAVKRHFKRSVE